MAAFDGAAVILLTRLSGTPGLRAVLVVTAVGGLVGTALDVPLLFFDVGMHGSNWITSGLIVLTAAALPIVAAFGSWVYLERRKSF